MRVSSELVWVVVRVMRKSLMEIWIEHWGQWGWDRQWRWVRWGQLDSRILGAYPRGYLQEEQFSLKIGYNILT
jgi:hypothetical protein